MLRTLTSTERKELVDAAIEKYRGGEYGPVSFKMRMKQIGGFDDDELRFLRDLHIDECARNMRA